MLFTEHVGRVKKDGGKANAASTVVSSMFGNSALPSPTLFYHPVLMSLAAKSCRSRNGAPAETHLQGKELKELQFLWFQTTPQETARCER